MSSSDLSCEALLRMFKRDRIADLDHLRGALGTTSRTTVFRRLSALGYLTSYSHAGRYYTLREIPAFDSDGLWRHGDVLFSRDGTLARTLVRLVGEADAGQFHRELQLRLRLRVHNTLGDLVAHEQLGRSPLWGEYLYTSAEKVRAAAQLTCRTGLGPVSRSALGAPLAPALMVEVLLEVIRGASLRCDPAQVAARLVARGVTVTVTLVEEIMERHGVKKTAPPRSRRSRR
jgi:hypothetical protein